MRLIKCDELKEFVNNHVTNALEPGKTELDIRLGGYAWIERDPHYTCRLHTMRKDNWGEHLIRIRIHESGITIKSGHFILAETVETFAMPEHIQGIMTLRSWAAKTGLEQSSSLILKAGWSGVLILELFNSLSRHDLLLLPGLALAQVQFFDIS